MGQKTSTEIKILDILDLIDADVNPEAMTTISSERTLLRFTVPKEHYKHIPLLVQLAAELSFHATLRDEAIEIERQALLSSLEKEDGKEDTIQVIRNILPETIRSFYRKWYQPNHFTESEFNFVLVHLSGNLSFTIGEELIQLSFSPEAAPKSTPKASFDSFTPSDLPSFSINNDHLKEIIDQLRSDGTENVTIDGKEYVLIDGKILVEKSPGLGWFDSIFFIGCVVGFILAATGLLPPFVGTAAAYFLLFGGLVYLSDEDFVESLKRNRTERLLEIKSFTQINSYDLCYTLTPREARQLFIHEYYYQPDIETISKLWYFDTIEFELLFTDQELYLIRYIVNKYRQEMNNLTHFLDEIEYTLHKHLEDARENRDSHLKETQNTYNANYFVIHEKQLRQERDQAIQDYKEAHKAAVEDLKLNAEAYGHTKESLAEEIKKLEEELAASIDAMKEWYDSQMTGEIVAGLEQAKAILKQSQDTIQQEYQQEVKRIKQEFGYSESYAKYSAQVEVLITDCNLILQNILAEFDPDEPSIEDFLIL